MGTDISLYIEYKDENGKWILNEEQKCQRCNGTCIDPLYNEADRDCFSNEDDDLCGECYGLGYMKCDIGRSYILFSILADVRNIHEVVPISEPRGIPEDASAEYIKIANDDHYDHSHSYHTLKQLKEYDGEYNGERGWEYLRGYFPDTLEELASKYGGDDNVRVLFFFDN